MQRLLVRGAYVAESQVPVPLSDLPRRFYRTRSARVATHPAHGRTSRLLDDERKRETLPYIERLRDELSIPIVYVSHRLAEVQCLTGHIVRLDAGRVAVIMSFSCSLRVNSTRLRPTPIEDDASTCRFFETNGCVRVSETGCAMATVGAKQPGGGKWPKAERLVWMAPALQGICEGLACLVGVQSCVRPVCAVMTAGPDGFRGRAPILLCGLRRPRHSAGCSRPRSDRFAITSHGPRNLFARYRADREARPQATAEPRAGTR
jgi:energy-coupling factor transporter ATP-binding protein EcfA2